jgi:hypothetical protein
LVTLDEDQEHGVEVESTGPAVAGELLLDGNTSLTSCATTFTNDVMEHDSDRAKESGEDNIVHPPSAGKGGSSSIGGDVVVEGVSLQRQQDKVMLR